VLQGCETDIQTLNEHFTNPRGIRAPAAPPPGAVK
jgi:hypothetical protein